MCAKLLASLHCVQNDGDEFLLIALPQATCFWVAKRGAVASCGASAQLPRLSSQVVATPIEWLEIEST